MGISSKRKAYEISILDDAALSHQEQLYLWLHPQRPVLWSSCSFNLSLPQDISDSATRVLADARWGSITLLQTDFRLRGFIVLANQALAAEGRVQIDQAGNRGVFFSASGNIGSSKVQLAFTSTLERAVLIGRFVVAVDNAEAFSGAFHCPNILFQKQDGPQKAGDSGCGEKIWGPNDTKHKIANTDINIRSRITVYQRCVIIEYLDDHGNVLSTTKLDKTNEDPASGGRTIIGYGGDDQGTIVRPHEEGKKDIKGWGHWFFLAINGCSDKLTYFQFIKVVAKLTGEDHLDSGWKPDPEPKGTPNAGTLSGEGGVSGIFLDFPGVEGNSAASPCPKEKHVKDSVTGGNVAKPLEEGDEYRLLQDFETFVCCGKTVLGYYSWSFVMTYTYHKGSGWSDPVSRGTGNPTWEPDAKKSPNNKDVQCPTV